MRRSITIHEAMEAWSAQYASREHILPEDLYELLLRPVDPGIQAALFPHLAQCPGCRQELQQLAQSMAEAEGLAVAWPKAAAADVEWPKTIPTAGGRYMLEIRRSLSQAHRGVLTVRVAESHRAAVEGKTVRVTDGEGRVLLRGQIIAGEASQIIEGLDSLDLRFLVQLEGQGA